jgi:hypothetical protein
METRFSKENDEFCRQVTRNRRTEGHNGEQDVVQNP